MLNKKLCLKCFLSDCKNPEHYVFNDDDLKDQIEWFLDIWRSCSKCACPEKMNTIASRNHRRNVVHTFLNRW